jgi:hypothetical protein
MKIAPPRMNGRRRPHRLVFLSTGKNIYLPLFLFSFFSFFLWSFTYLPTLQQLVERLIPILVQPTTQSLLPNLARRDRGRGV